MPSSLSVKNFQSLLKFVGSDSATLSSSSIFKALGLSNVAYESISTMLKIIRPSSISSSVISPSNTDGDSMDTGASASGTNLTARALDVADDKASESLLLKCSKLFDSTGNALPVNKRPRSKSSKSSAKPPAHKKAKAQAVKKNDDDDFEDD